MQFVNPVAFSFLQNRVCNFNKQASVDYSLKLDAARLLRNNRFAYKIFLGIAKQSQEGMQLFVHFVISISIVLNTCTNALCS